MLLLIHWLFVLSLFEVGGCCDWSLFFAMHYLVAFHFCNIWPKKNSWLLYFSCILASAFDCLWCSVSLPHGAVGCAAVCNCGISWSYLFFF